MVKEEGVLLDLNFQFNERNNSIRDAENKLFITE